MITIANNYFQDLNAAIAAGLFPANAKPKKQALYDAIAVHNAAQDEPVTVSEAIPEASDEAIAEAELPAVDIKALEEAGDEEALQAALLAMDAADDAVKQQQLQAKPTVVKKTRKLTQADQARKNAEDLVTYRRIVDLKEAIGATKAAEQITAEGRPMGGTTVSQICTTYNKVLMASQLIQQLYHDGLVTWGELYSRSRKINISAIEAELGARLPQAG